MKKQILIILLILFNGLQAQIAPAFVASINVTDLSNRSQALQFGLDPVATDGIDSNLGEYLLPPIPPAGVFDARFILPSTETTLKDIRTGTSTSFGTKEHILKYQAGTGTNIKVMWDFPKGVNGRLQDRITGNVIDIAMVDTGSYTVTNPETITSLKMTVTYMLGELANPRLVSPLKNATGILLSPTFIWNRTDYTASYELQVATDELFGNIIYKDSTLIDTVKQIEPINALTNYYWKVRGKNIKGYSSWSEEWSFTTTHKPLLAPSNLIVTALNYKEIILFWKDNSENETGFIIQRKSGDSSSVFAFENIDTVLVNISSVKDSSVLDGTTYTYRVYAFNQDTVSDFSNFASIKTNAKITGAVYYNNAPKTPLVGVQIFLKNGAVVSASTITDLNGNYLFNNVNDGIYQITVKSDKPINGITSTDALLIRRYTVGLIPLTALQLQAADVNASGVVNSTDALQIRRFIVGHINSFPAGSWVFETPTVTVSGSGVLKDILGNVVGDLNGSFGN